jgi:predicted amidophosphoribosyltransferase
VSGTRRELAHEHDSWLPDHLPTCPHCGNLCGKLAQVCYDCGARLYDTHTNDGRRRLTAEDTQPTKGTEA